MSDKDYNTWINSVKGINNKDHSWIDGIKSNDYSFGYTIDKNYVVDTSRLYNSIIKNDYIIDQTKYDDQRNDLLKAQLRRDYIIDVYSMYGHEVDVESLPIKTINDDLIRKNVDYLLILPQTPERCLLALDVEWSKRVYDMITIPITGDFHKQFLKMKLSKGYLE